jgi:hypothetical protein
VFAGTRCEQCDGGEEAKEKKPGSDTGASGSLMEVWSATVAGPRHWDGAAAAPSASEQPRLPSAGDFPNHHYKPRGR